MTTATFAATAYFAALDASAAVRSNGSVWRQLVQAVTKGPTRGAQDEVADYLQRHQHDMSPALRIELERCHFFF